MVDGYNSNNNHNHNYNGTRKAIKSEKQLGLTTWTPTPGKCYSHPHISFIYYSFEY